MKQRITPILKSLLIAYLLTGGLLLVLALLLYRFHLSEGVVTGCIVAIYVVASCLAGFLMGKNAGERKFLWGLLQGLLYFSILLLISFILNRSLSDAVAGVFASLAICGGSGMVGGMLS